MELGIRPGFAHARHKGVHQAVHFGNREATDHTDAAGLGHRPSDDAGQIRGVLNVVVEHRKVRVRGLVGHEGRPQKEGHARIFGAHFAGFLLGAKDFADDELHALFAILAHHAGIVGVGHVFGVDVVNGACRLGGFGGLMDAADPLLLDRNRIDARHLDRSGGIGAQRQKPAKRQGCAHRQQAPAA